MPSITIRLWPAPSIAALALSLLVPGIVVGVAPSQAGRDDVDMRIPRTTYPRPWGSVEDYYLQLLNCTRTGGWVKSNGECTGYGSGHFSVYRPPVSRDLTLAGKVSRPYGKKVAVANVCAHDYGSEFGERMRAAGYRSWAGENLGCRSGDPYKAVLASHRYFQSEREYNGGHWQNIKDSRWRTVGIGVWVYAGRVRLVTDLYQP